MEASGKGFLPTEESVPCDAECLAEVTAGRVGGPSYGADLASGAREAVARTRAWLCSQQHADGHWVAELEGDTILESETILLLAFLGREDSELARRCARYLVEKQLPEGGWAMYPGGGVEISGSVKAYFALKLTGHDVEAEYMVRARRAIRAHGGADAVESLQGRAALGCGLGAAAVAEPAAVLCRHDDVELVEVGGQCVHRH